MPAVRIVRFNSQGNEIEVARLPSLGDALLFARAAGDRTAWLVLSTRPPVWLSAASVVDEPAGPAPADRFYLLAREVLANQGMSAADVDAQLPLAPGGSVPADA